METRLIMHRLLVLCALAPLAACGSSAEDPTTGGCTPMATAMCACPDGTTSAQQCLPSGDGYSPCQCGGTSVLPPTQGTGGGSSVLPAGGAAGTPIIPSGGAAGTPIIPSGGAAGTPVIPSGGAAGTPIEPVGGAAGMGSGLNPDGTLPPVSDYGAYGPFTPVRIMNTGPGGAYTMVRPEVLGQNGFKHPLATWGNGIITTPAAYVILLDTIASHGFVIIASNSTNVTAQMMTSGLDWLIQQNTQPGEFQGMLDPARSVSIGYSLGGGGAVNTGSHPNVITTVSFHGLQGAAENLHGPLLLFTSTGDTFVSAAGYVTPTFNRSTVPTFYATLIGGDHLTPLNDAGPERAPAVAWLRLWVYGDEGARPYFYGADCILCRDPWTNPQTKNWQ